MQVRAALNAGPFLGAEGSAFEMMGIFKGLKFGRPENGRPYQVIFDCFTGALAA